MKKIKLFCIPYAGGSAYAYLPWKKYLNDTIELNPVQLAGRGERISEPEYDGLEDAAKEVFTEISDIVTNSSIEYALYGHSMGSWILYEVAKNIVKAKIPLPKCIFVSANRAPFYSCESKKISTLPKSLFIEEILKMGGAKREVLEDPEFGDIFVGILRRDYKMIEKYKCKNNSLKMQCDIFAFNGIYDNIPREGILAWKECTNKNFKIIDFNGNHFFIDSCTSEVVSSINQILLK